MKKSTFMIGVASLALLAFVSCKKSENKATSFQGTTSEFVVEDEDRAYLDAQNYFVFEQGDEVMMFNISATPSESECAKYAAKSTGRHVFFKAAEDMTVESKGSFYAFFPAGNVTPSLGEENRATFTLSDTQEYYEVNGVPSFSKTDMYCAAKATAANIEDCNFIFDNICGILRLKYYSTTPLTLKSITVVDRHFGLSGDVNLKVDKVTSAGLVDLCNSYDPANPENTAQAITNYKNLIGYNVTNAGNSITLDLGAGKTLSNNASNPSVFYIVLRPLALSHGYDVYATDNNGNTVQIVESSSNKKIVPNTIKGIAAKDLAPYFN